MVWFVPDTGYSLISGYSENAILNITVLACLAVPLAALARRHRTSRRS